MKLLVTGGAGFIGSNFIRLALRERPNFEIINLDDLTYAGNLETIKDLEEHPRYSFIKADICDKEVVRSLVGQVDAIVHFAAETHVDRSIDDAAAFIRTNVSGTHTLLEAARQQGGKRFHHISTDEVFGSLGPKDPKFCEATPYDPRSPYAASKAASDHLVRSYFHTFGLPITISNCSNNYGPYQYPEKLIPFFITNLMAGQKVPLYGDGLNIRDWIHVDDHNKGVLTILEQGRIGETYCLGGNAERTNKEITKLILDSFGFGEEMIEYVDDRKGHDRRYAIDFSKIENELGWKPEKEFSRGIEETITWYKENEWWWRPLQELRTKN